MRSREIFAAGEFCDIVVIVVILIELPGKQFFCCDIVSRLIGIVNQLMVDHAGVCRDI